MRKVYLLTLCAFLVSATVSAQGFKAKPRDPKAVYAIKATQSDTGQWIQREVIKLCPLATPAQGKHGEKIIYIAVAPTKECPSAVAPKP